MYLQQAEIRNFRGIRQLKVDFENDCTVLIGENSWGKSSLLRALWMAMGCGEKLCRFAPEDLYVPIPLLEDSEENSEQSSDEQFSLRPALHFSSRKRRRDSIIEQMHQEAQKEDARGAYFRKEYEFSSQDCYRDKADKVQFDFIFAESAFGSELLTLPQLKKFWSYGDDGIYRIHWRIVGRRDKDIFKTEHLVICKTQADQKEVRKGILALIRLNPVLRIRDQRMNRSATDDEERLRGDGSYVFENFAESFKNDMAISAPEMKRRLDCLNDLSQRYLTNYSGPAILKDRSRQTRNNDILGRTVSIETLSSLRETMEKPGINKVKILTTLLAGVVLSSQGERKFSVQASPIIIFEDIEARFHPSLLLSFWSIVSAVRVQKIVTTNSGDLLSAIPLQALRRLYRPYYDTRSYKADVKSLSLDDQRRIAFHLRINRPMTFFARTWLLVEGETEIWVISQAAAILGISLQCDGIRTVEFAQCGLNPIMKLARQLGIAFFVMTDGDEAGRSYCEIVKKFVPERQLDAHLTRLPSVDIEHYLYCSGFESVFLRCAGIRGPLRKGTTSDRVIELAIRKKTKPGLAIEVIEEMRRRGAKGVPPVIVDMIYKLRALCRGDFL